MAKYGYFCEDIPKSDKKHITTMRKTPTAARHALLACRHMLMAVSAICALAACGGDDELTAPHEHTQDEIKARQYLGYYPCEIDIDDFHGWTADGSYHCSGINKKHLWFAVYDEATTALKLQWFDTARFDRELTYATADGSERTGRISTISADRFIPAQSGGGSPSGWCMAFKATLEEALVSDFLIHVVDSSSPDAVSHVKTTLEVLKELGADEKKVLTVMNKCDLPGDDLVRHELSALYPDAVWISVKSGEGLGELTGRIEGMLAHTVRAMHLFIPHADYKAVADLHNAGSVTSQKTTDDGVDITANVPLRMAGAYEKWIHQ